MPLTYNCTYTHIYTCTATFTFALHAVSTITEVYTIEEVLRAQASGKETSFSGIVYALLMSINIDESDPACSISYRWLVISVVSVLYLLVHES